MLLVSPHYLLRDAVRVGVALVMRVKRSLWSVHNHCGRCSQSCYPVRLGVAKLEQRRSVPAVTRTRLVLLRSCRDPVRCVATHPLPAHDFTRHNRQNFCKTYERKKENLLKTVSMWMDSIYEEYQFVVVCSSFLCIVHSLQLSTNNDFTQIAKVYSKTL